MQKLEYIQSLVQKHTSILLDISDVNMIEVRLIPLIRKEGFKTVEELVEELKNGHCSRDLPKKVVESLLNNETSFFRDISLFRALKNLILPELMQKKQRSLDKVLIWSAACSTGQEPYSLAMSLAENFPFQVYHESIKITASDLSGSVISYAKGGKYTTLEVNRGLPADLLIKYFRQEGVNWLIDDRIRKMIEFHQINLIEPMPEDFPRMDLILLRNILIYFDVDVKKDILAQIRRYLLPDGILILGSSETTVNIDNSFEPVYFENCVCYKLRSLYC